MAGEGGQKCTTPIHVTNRAGTQGSRTLIVNQTSVTGAIAGATTEQTITFLDAVTFTDNRVKWHPGYYLQNDRNATALKTQSVRFAMYDGSTVANNSHLTGVLYLAPWSQLEGATHGDYAAGFALIHAEINKLKGLAQPKRLIVMLFDEVNYSICGGQTCQDGYYPVYLKNAGCLVFGSGVWDVGSGINRFKRWNTTCQGYEADMLNAYGAEFDGEAYFEGWALTYETEVQGTIQTNGGFTEPAWDTGLAASATTARAAFPHSNIFFSGVNFAPQGGNATINAWFSTWSGLGVGWGNGDTCNYAGTEAGIYYPSDNITAGRQQVGGNWTANQSNDYRGQIPYVGKVETSELGENSVCGSPGYTGLRPSPNPSGYGSVFDHWDTVMHASHGLVEHNTWAGTSVQQWTNVANSLLDMVNTHPITHTSCPTIYNTKYGNGTAGSGCNLN
jgi:hypothetical protein